MGSSLRFDADSGHCWIGTQERTGDGADTLILKEADLNQVTASEFFDLVMNPDVEGCYGAVGIDLAHPDEYWPKGTVVDQVMFRDDGGRPVVAAGFTTETYVEDEEATDLFGPIVTPLLTRSGMSLVRVVTDGRASGPYCPEVYFTPLRECTLGDLFAIGKDISELLKASEEGRPTRTTAGHLIRGGKAELLLGLPEGPWLDAKSQLYDPTNEGGKISLAQSVARFANGDQGGLVVFGMGTKNTSGGGEVISKLQPVPLAPKLRRQYEQVLEQRLFPAPFGLDIFTVELSAGEGLLVLELPPQPEELKPFLVHGAIVDGKVEGAFISIVRRSGENSVPITGPQIHSTLAAGRALLRRGQLPSEEPPRADERSEEGEHRSVVPPSP